MKVLFCLKTVFFFYFLLFPSISFSFTNLTGIKVLDPRKVEIEFDKEVQSDQIKVNYFRDIIQISIDGASVYPAKIIPIKHSELKKVFAYQYTPRSIRCRFSVDHSSEKYKNITKIETKGRKLIFSLDSNSLAQTDSLTIQSAKATTVKAEQIPLSEGTSIVSPIEEKKLLEKIKMRESKGSRLTSGESPKGIYKGFYWTILIVIMFGILVVALRYSRNSGTEKKLSKVLSKFGVHGRDKIIEVLSTQYIGPKKSIAIVKIQKNKFVLGITNESINLITKLDDDSDENDSSGILDNEPKIDSSESVGFSNVLGREYSKPTTNEIENIDRTESVRSKIKEKLSGMKSL